MTFEEAMEATVTQDEAHDEIADHDGADWSEFVEEFGLKETYQGSDVLGWLGY